MTRYTIVLFSLFITFLNARAQEKPYAQLAHSYYQNKEFDKALDVFKKLFDDSQSRSYFDYTIRCYLALKQYDEAEKFVRKQMKKYDDDPSYSVVLGHVMWEGGDTLKARQLFLKSIKTLPEVVSKYLSIGTAFEQYRYFEMALETYKAGQKTIGKQYSFHNELANVYLVVRDYKKMVDEYLYLIEENASYLDIMKTRLQSLVVNDIDNQIKDVLKQKLLEKIQKDPEVVAFAEILAWVFEQEKEFGAALVQTKSIDARLKEQGERVYKLGETAFTNSDYSVAIDCFQYVIEKGVNTPFYEDARSKMLATLNKKILENPAHTRAEELKLDQMLGEAIQQMGITPRTAPLLIDRAHLKAFYLREDTMAINLLENALESKILSQAIKSDIRMELGDIYLYTGDTWEANLVFAKVETDREGSPIAHEARFRRARIAYFMGDFEWSRALLDVLKTATSKLTSNDAFELSLLISENTADDTVFDAMRLFASADYLSFRNKDSLALLSYDSIPDRWPGNPLEDDIQFRKAKVFTRSHNFEKAAQCYLSIIEKYADEIYSDDALFLLASLYENALGDKQKAMEYYKKLVSDFASSVYVVEARARFRILRGDGVHSN